MIVDSFFFIRTSVSKHVSYNDENLGGHSLWNNKGIIQALPPSINNTYF